MGKKVKLGLIGLGGRGMGLLKLVFVHHEDVEFTAVCDVYEDRCQEAVEVLEKAVHLTSADSESGAGDGAITKTNSLFLHCWILLSNQSH